MVPAAEIRSRLARLRQALGRRRLGAALFTAGTDVRYFSGFTGSESALLITAKAQFLLTDFRYQEEAQASAPLFECLLGKQGLMAEAARLARQARVKRLGYDERQVTVADGKRLRSAARGVSLTDLSDLAGGLRVVKSGWEITRMTRALRLAEAALTAVRGRLRPEMTEADLRLELEHEMRRRGAEAEAFETIVAAGPNASRPHAHAERRKIGRGRPILIDFGARREGYNSDLTRVFFLDSIPPFWRQSYELTLEAQRAGWVELRPGAECAAAHRAALEVFRAAGTAEKFGHSLGHGVGLAVHEAPRLSLRSTEKLAPGMVVTVEPGQYHPGRGGIRIEDMALITPRGVERLSRLPNTLDWAVL